MEGESLSASLPSHMIRVICGIEGHANLTIIKADGEILSFSQRITQIASGQRFSVLLQTKTLAEVEAEPRPTCERLRLCNTFVQHTSWPGFHIGRPSHNSTTDSPLR